MNEIGMLGSSFIFVFALSFQQENIHYGRYCLAIINSACIASLNLFVVAVGAQASPTEMMAFIIGQPLGTVAAMWLSKQRLRHQLHEPSSASEPGRYEYRRHPVRSRSRKDLP